MKYRAVAVALALLTLGSGQLFADEEILKNDDGSMPASFEVEEGIAARFLPKSSFEPVRVSINLVEPLKPFYVHIWSDDGSGLPDTGTELVEPVLVEPDSEFVRIRIRASTRERYM